VRYASSHESHKARLPIFPMLTHGAEQSFENNARINTEPHKDGPAARVMLPVGPCSNGLT
jgi:hypothetical protein